MKKDILVFCFFACLLIGCSKSLEKQEPVVSLSKEQTISSSVSMGDIGRYLGKINKLTKSDGSLTSIVPIVATSRDTVMYLINYEDGWEIISGDKRTPAIIAYSEHGNASLNGSNPGFSLWIKSVTSDMERVKNAPNEDLAFTDEDIILNQAFWSDTPISTLSIPPVDINPGVEIIEGEWVFVRTETGLDPIRVVNHLMDTQWDQGSPYDYMCPKKDESNSADWDNHKPAGCVAVAGAQMLYYLYQHKGSPVMATPNIPMSSLHVPYSTSPSETGEVASFLRHVGNILDMHYNDEFSWAFPSNLVDMLEYYGYSSSYVDFNASKVEENLNDGMPVIVAAYDGSVLDIPLVWTGHAFVIDGYRLVRAYTRDLYKFVPDNPNIPLPIDFETYRYETKYLESFINYVKMNWGWWTQWSESHKNDGWYGLTGNWVVNVSGKQYNYHSYMHMVTDISPIN